MKTGKERLKYVDVIRFIAVCLIVISHFNLSLPVADISIYGNPYLVKSEFLHGSFGTLGVSLFFIISGVTLYYNYGDEIDVKQFMKKRFLGIYPTFWCSYILVFLILFFKNKQFWFVDVPKWRFGLTLLGMDGYFRYLGNNFYLIGEWFLGCIIIFYILFPVLRICVNKYPLPTVVLAVILYVLTAVCNPFKVGITYNIIIRICDFLFGMLWAKYMRDRRVNVKVFLLSILYLMTSSLIGKVGVSIFIITIFGWALFIALVFLFERIDFSKAYIIKLIGKYSYEIFLLHHVCISLYVNNFRGHDYSLYEGLVLFAGLIVLIYAAVAIEKLVEREAGKLLQGFLQTSKKG